jgi:hypothetical protein
MGVKLRFFTLPASWFLSNLMACHSERARRSLTEPGRKVTGDVSKAKATEESPGPLLFEPKHYYFSQKKKIPKLSLSFSSLSSVKKRPLAQFTNVLHRRKQR